MVRSLAGFSLCLLLLGNVWAQETEGTDTDDDAALVISDDAQPDKPKNEQTVVAPGGGGTPSSFSSKLGTEELNKLKTTDSITANTTDLFGERVDLNTGGISFNHVDLSLPGNNAIEMSVRRTFRGTKFTWADELGFGDWQLDIPYIHTI